MDDQRQKSEMQPLKDGRLEQVYSGMDKIGPAATEKCGQRTSEEDRWHTRKFCSWTGEGRQS